MSVSVNIPDTWSATRTNPPHAPSFSDAGPTVPSNKPTSEQESHSKLSTGIEALSAIGHADHRFNSHSSYGCWSFVLPFQFKPLCRFSFDLPKLTCSCMCSARRWRAHNINMYTGRWEPWMREIMDQVRGVRKSVGLLVQTSRIER